MLRLHPPPEGLAGSERRRSEGLGARPARPRRLPPTDPEFPPRPGLRRGETDAEPRRGGGREEGVAHAPLTWAPPAASEARAHAPARSRSCAAPASGSGRAERERRRQAKSRVAAETGRGQTCGRGVAKRAASRGSLGRVGVIERGPGKAREGEQSRPAVRGRTNDSALGWGGTGEEMSRLGPQLPRARSRCCCC